MKTPQLFFEQISFREKRIDDLAEGRRNVLTNEIVETAISDIEKSNEEILAAYSPEMMRAAVARKMDARKKTPLRFAVGSIFTVRNVSFMAAAAACLAIAVFVAGPYGVSRSSASNGAGILAGAERAKGDGPRQYVYLQDGDQAIQLENNSIVRENDVLQLSYIAAGQTYGIILSIDGNGTVSQHFPDSGAAAAKLETGGEIPLPFSYKLDDAPAFERFFFITGTKPFTVASFIENIRMRTRVGDMQSADLSRIVPMNTRLTEITLLK